MRVPPPMCARASPTVSTKRTNPAACTRRARARGPARDRWSRTQLAGARRGIADLGDRCFRDLRSSIDSANAGRAWHRSRLSGTSGVRNSATLRGAHRAAHRRRGGGAAYSPNRRRRCPTDAPPANVGAAADSRTGNTDRVCASDASGARARRVPAAQAPAAAFSEARLTSDKASRFSVGKPFWRCKPPYHRMWP